MHDASLDVRLARAAPYWTGAALAVAASGAVSAATAFAPGYLASWTAAFLALVLGLAQAVIGTARVLLPPRPPHATTTLSEALAYDAAGLAVLAGTALDRPTVTTAGAALMLIVLAVWATADRHSARGGPWRWALRGVVSLLAISVPVGVALAWWS